MQQRDQGFDRPRVVVHRTDTTDRNSGPTELCTGDGGIIDFTHAVRNHGSFGLTSGLCPGVTVYVGSLLRP